jgi:hypothetical protein
MALPSHANFLILRTTTILPEIICPIIALGSITQVRMVPEDWPSEAILIPHLERMSELRMEVF